LHHNVEGGAVEEQTGGTLAVAFQTRSARGGATIAAVAAATAMAAMQATLKAPSRLSTGGDWPWTRR
jgi:hypothetical protein